MTDRSLSSLYRRLGSRVEPAPLDLLDADTLVAAAEGSLRGERRDDVAARLARSPMHTDLVRLLRDLAPAAEALAGAVNDRGAAGHTHGRRAGVRHAASARRGGALRWAGLAACLAITLGAVSWHQQRLRHDEAAMLAAMEMAARPDRIFTNVDRIFSAAEAASHGDKVFHAGFNGG
ncbi:hypothetical protein ACQQ2N_01605 [Dokdonella sp. MW10]|uniref:hypothetical protein n=1 Tax=Dokdonella sp. MW10 TaxID=2992926 RepID=UPI003F805C59